MREMRAVLVGMVIALVAVVLGGCDGGNDDPPTAATTATSTATAEPTATATASEPPATATVSLEDEVAEAYLAYWDAYADAVLNLDISLVEDFAAGDELEGIRHEIETLRADGVAARIRVEHDFQVVSVTETSAVVVDEYVNNSFYVDPETKEPDEGEGTGDVVTDTILMENIDGRWVVVSGAREAAD